MEARGRRVSLSANESDSFPDPVEQAMSKHERRAPRQSQLKLKVEGKDSAVQMARTGVLLAPKQQLPPQMARTDLLHTACSVAGAKSATPTACVASAEMALGLRQTLYSAGHWRFLPPFFFCGCWCNFFSTPPCFTQGLSHEALNCVQQQNVTKLHQAIQLR